MHKNTHVQCFSITIIKTKSPREIAIMADDLDCSSMSGTLLKRLLTTWRLLKAVVDRWRFVACFIQRIPILQVYGKKTALCFNIIFLIIYYAKSLKEQGYCCMFTQHNLRNSFATLQALRRVLFIISSYCDGKEIFETNRWWPGRHLQDKMMFDVTSL